MAGLIKICGIGDIPPGTMRAQSVDGVGSLAIFNVEGQIYVTSNLCTHGAATLTDGYFNEDTIECPLHGGSFDVKTGEAIQFPCRDPLQTFAVTINDGNVFLNLTAVQAPT